jgi:hypothetical protein
MASLESDLLSWVNALGLEGTPAETLQEACSVEKLTHLLSLLFPSDQCPDPRRPLEYIYATTACFIQTSFSTPPLLTALPEHPLHVGTFLLLFYLSKLKGVADALPSLSARFETWLSSAPREQLSLESASAHLRSLTASVRRDASSSASIAEKSKTRQRLIRERELCATVENALVDLLKAVGDLERTRESLVQELTAQDSAAALLREIDVLEQKRADRARELEVCESLLQERLTLQAQIDVFRALPERESAVREQNAEQTKRVEEAGRRLAQLCREAGEAERAARALEERAKAVDPDAVRIQWLGRLGDEVVRLEAQTFEIETVVSLGEDLAGTFGWPVK